MNTPDYVIELWDINGNYVLDISRFVEPDIELKLNDADVITFSIDHKKFTELCDSVNLEPRNILYPALTNVIVKRNGLILTGGEVSNADTTKDGNGHKTIEVTVDGFENYLAHRRIKKVYTATDRSDIAWDAIETIQAEANGDYNIIRGVHTDTYDSDLKADYATVKSIIQLYTYAQPTTYDFDLLPTIVDKELFKVFNTYLRKGSDRPEIQLIDPVNSDFNNIRRSSDTLANLVIGLGAGIGEERLESLQSDALSQAKYRVRDNKTMFSSVIRPDTLDENTDGVLQMTKAVLATFDCKPRPGTIDLSLVGLGDSVYCRQESDTFNDDIDGLFRIYGMTIKVDKQRHEEITLNFYNPGAGGELSEGEE